VTSFPWNWIQNSVEIREAGGGWEVVIHTENYGMLTVWMEMPDPLYDQLHEQDVLTLQDGDVVSTLDWMNIVCNHCGHVRATTEEHPTLVTCDECGSPELEYQ